MDVIINFLKEYLKEYGYILFLDIMFFVLIFLNTYLYFKIIKNFFNKRVVFFWVYSDFLGKRKKTCYLFFIFIKSKSSFSLYAKTEDKNVIFNTFFNFTKVIKKND